MQKVIVSPFQGTIPRVDKTLLPNTHAQTAVDCYLKNGTLKPAQGLASAGFTLLAGSRSWYRYNRAANEGQGFIFQWSDAGVSVAPSPIVDDVHRRVYWTGQGSPKFTGADVATAGDGPYPSAVYELGIPAPNAFTATGPTGSSPAGSTRISTSYVMTFVDKYGAEGPPSPATSVIERWDGSTVSLVGLQVPSGAFVIEFKRIYRVEMQGVYQLVATIPASQISHNDTVDSVMMGVMLPSERWVAPNPAMQGLTSLPNGVMMGWWENILAFSEPYRPWAWPIEYRHALDDNIMGAGLSDVGIIVATEGKPYLIVGAGPDSFSETKLDIEQSCVSAKSFVDMGPYVVYASKEGLVGNGSVLTAGHMTAEQFAELNPESIHAYRWNDRYLAFYDAGGSNRGAFTFHPEEGFLFYSQHGQFGQRDLKTGEVLLKNFGQTAVNVWHSGNPVPYTWRSRVFHSSALRPPGVAQIDADSYPVTFRYYGDGVLLKTVTVQNRSAFRLPNRNYLRDIEFELTSTNAVRSVQIAQSMSEIT